MAYLNLLVDKVFINENTATVTDSYDALAHAVALNDTKKGHLNQAPTSVSDWGARDDGSGHWMYVINLG